LSLSQKFCIERERVAVKYISEDRERHRLRSEGQTVAGRIPTTSASDGIVNGSIFPS